MKKTLAKLITARDALKRKHSLVCRIKKERNAPTDLNIMLKTNGLSEKENAELRRIVRNVKARRKRDNKPRLRYKIDLG